MRYFLLTLFAIGCGGSIGETIPDAGVPPISAEGDPFGCKLVGNACQCVIPANSAEAIVAMQERCDYLRDVSAALY